MRFLPRPWLLPLLAVTAVVALLQGYRWHRVLELTALPEWSVDVPAPQASSPTGYAAGRRQLIVADPTGQSQQWIAQTQRMLAEKRWLIDHVDYDNAPFGRETHLPMSYRLWLAGLAWLESTVGRVPAGLAVEHAALYADLLLQGLAGLALLWFVSREFGRFAALMAGVAWLTLHPLATNFLPGAPQSQGLAEICVLWSLLPLAAGLSSSKTKPSRLFFSAGLAGGLGLSLNLNTQLSVIAGTALGAILAAAFARRTAATEAAPPWAWWGLGGALASLAAYAAQYFPGSMALRLESNHPLYAVGWIALGCGLDQAVSCCARRTERPPRRKLLAGLLAGLGLAGIVTFVVSRHPSLLAVDLTVSRLTRLPGGVANENLGRWLALEGASARVWATLLPAALLVTGVLVALLRPAPDTKRVALAFVLGPLLVAAGFSCGLLRWWNTFDSVAIAGLAVALAGRRASDSWGWIAGATAAAGLGLIQLIPPRATFHAGEFEPAEMQAVMERDLAQWIAQRQPNAVVLAPPGLTTSLWYYGGLRGITTFDPANHEGALGALRLAAAITPQEAHVLLMRREVTHLVLPSWDRGLDEAAREISGSSKDLFIELLREWSLPGWTRPVAYYLPAIEGFRGHTVLVLEFTHDQPDAIRISRMATYFLEAGLPGHAGELRKFLGRFPQDLGALVSLAEIARARGDEPAFFAALAALDAPLAAKADRRIPWERRIALATVLAQGGRGPQAREQAAKCYAEADEESLRQLSPKTLYFFLTLGRTFGLEPADPLLRARALDWLPPDFRAQLQ